MSVRIALGERFGLLRRTTVAAVLVAGAVIASPAMSVTLPVASAGPAAMPTDSQGFVNSPARCGANQSAVAVGRTMRSLIAICGDDRGRYEYRGMRLSDGAMLTLPATSLENGCFGAQTPDVYYTVSERKLLLTAGLRILRDEPMVEFRDYRGGGPVAVPVADMTTNRTS